MWYIFVYCRYDVYFNDLLVDRSRISRGFDVVKRFNQKNVVNNVLTLCSVIVSSVALKPDKVLQLVKVGVKYVVGVPPPLQRLWFGGGGRRMVSGRVL